ncbi:hypothetical protein niasHS_013480 [Heterodera schachtii]|uniref:BZIP domain-containing protein n=1 Tax=Heterodera schachtii TaxID=97005 RepID=A0ABD2I8E9_HETSC
MLPSTVAHLPAPPPLSASPSCVSGVGLSFMDEMPSLGSLSLSSYSPLPHPSYPFDQFAGGANRKLVSMDGMDGRQRHGGSEGGNLGGGDERMGQQGQAELGAEWNATAMGGGGGQQSPLGWCPEEQCPLPMSTPQLSPLKTERPPSVAFVGLEPGTEQQFVDNSLHHYAHPFFPGTDHQLQFPHFHHNLTDYPWHNLEGSSGHGTHFQHNNGTTEGLYEGYAPPIGIQHQQEEEEQDKFEMTDISISGSDRASIPFDYGPTVLFDPLSVDSSASWSGAESNGHSSTEEGIEYSSLSQDEIYEQIQRECAEFENRSSSDEMPKQTPNSKKKTKRTKTVAAKKAAPLAMKKKAYAGRASASSVESAEVSAPPASGGRRERKKELNRVAATRYREKKRKEREETEEQMNELEQRNARLKADIAAVQAEMDYLKGLAAEIETARKQRGRQ